MCTTSFAVLYHHSICGWSYDQISLMDWGYLHMCAPLVQMLFRRQTCSEGPPTLHILNVCLIRRVFQRSVWWEKHTICADNAGGPSGEVRIWSKPCELFHLIWFFSFIPWQKMVLSWKQQHIIAYIVDWHISQSQNRACIAKSACVHILRVCFRS